MASNLIIVIFFSLALMECNVQARMPGRGILTEPNSGTFDITKYGAAPGKDISEALLCAWKEAIASPTPCKIVIPPGTWSLTQVKLSGPNISPIELVVQGTVQASPDVHALPDKEGEWIMIIYVCNLIISGGGVFDGQGQEAWKQNDCHSTKKICAILPMNLSFNFINNTIIRDVTTKDSKNFHVNCVSSHNVTFERFTVCAPGNSINTDGIHIGRSSMVKILDTTIQTGDDCVSIGDENCDVHISNVTCGPGHGISIGSLGKYPTEKDVKGIYVQNSKFLNTENGVRIKTWPSSPASLTVTDIHFEDLTMENVSNPVIIDQEYCPYNLCDKSKPSSIKISQLSIKNIKGTCSTCEALILACSTSNPCENVEIGDIDLKYTGTVGNITTKCSNIKPTFVGKQNPPVCAEAPAQTA